MRSFLKYLILLIIVSGISFFVFVWSSNTTKQTSYTLEFKEVSNKKVVDKITNFEHWYQWAKIDSTQFTAIRSTEAIGNKLITKNTAFDFKIENEIITDTLIVQHLYSLKDVKQTQKLNWKLAHRNRGSYGVLTIEENYNWIDKLYILMDWKHFRKNWLSSFGDRITLLQEDFNKNAEEYHFGEIYKSTLPSTFYLFIEIDVQNAENQHLTNIQIEDALKTLENFTTSKEIGITGSPFIIEPLDLRTKPALKVAIPIKENIQTGLFEKIKFAHLKEVEGLALDLVGNPNEYYFMWEEIYKKQESLEVKLGHTKYRILQSAYFNAEIKAKQQLFWSSSNSNATQKSNSLSEMLNSISRDAPQTK